MALTTDSSYRSWSGPARAMALAIDAAVAAAQSADVGAFTDAINDLGRVDREQTAVVLGAMTRDLLERAYPDGLDADDAEEVLKGAIRAGARWYPDIDSDAFIWAMTGALGIGDLDELPQRDSAAVLVHGLLLMSDLISGLAQPLPPVLDAALADLMRAQTVELP